VPPVVIRKLGISVGTQNPARNIIKVHLKRQIIQEASSHQHYVAAFVPARTVYIFEKNSMCFLDTDNETGNSVKKTNLAK